MRKLLALLLLLCTSTWAWQPTRPINVISPYGAGSNNELTFRKASEIVSRNNPGVNFVIQGRVGADGVIAMNSFVTAAPDGYNLAVPSIFSMFVGNDVFQSDTKRYNWDTFIPVSVLGETPMALIAVANSSVTTPAEFLQLLKNPTRFVNIATCSSATSFVFEYLIYLNGSKNMIENIPYKNVPDMSLAMLGGQSEFGVMPVAGAGKLAEAGKIKIIALTGDRPLPSMPAVPVMNAIKIQSGWYFTLPPNTPRDIVDWYQQEFSRAIRSDEYRQWAESQFITVDPGKLDPAGVKKYADFLRRTFLPVAAQINISK
jgi:tripartite-type tricarboxylate transporter receptor subunit TctC